VDKSLFFNIQPAMYALGIYDVRSQEHDMLCGFSGLLFLLPSGIINLPSNQSAAI
jgi:hypothetical protein